MKKVKLEKVVRITGKPFRLAQFDAEDRIKTKTAERGGQQVEEADVLVTTSLIDILEAFILQGIPRDKYTKNDAIRIGNIYPALKEAKKNGHVLAIDEAEHDWLKAKVGDDSIGVRFFTYDTQVILDALDNFERAHEPKEKSQDKEE